MVLCVHACVVQALGRLAFFLRTYADIPCVGDVYYPLEKKAATELIYSTHEAVF